MKEEKKIAFRVAFESHSSCELGEDENENEEESFNKTFPVISKSKFICFIFTGFRS
jgi:hypothetical protein